MANWGLNSEVAVKNVNKFLYQNSLVTVAYNYFGFTGFGVSPQYIIIDSYAAAHSLHLCFALRGGYQCIRLWDYSQRNGTWRHGNRL